jgi:phosphoribosylformylglycinamidine synthase
VSARVAVVVFPGSNCEHDVVAALAGRGADGRLVWHTERDLAGFDGVVVPGGFAHGDYLRPGAIARFSPVMDAVGRFAEAGRPVLGICNGFQVLAEAGLLPGALIANAGLRFICATVRCRVVSNRSALTTGLRIGSLLELPINHYEGNFTCDKAMLAEIVANDQVVLTYEDNPNGSLASIAGVANRRGNVVGLMPHPERACDPLVGGTDGAALIASFVDACRRPARRSAGASFG